MKLRKVFSSLMALGLMTTIAACGNDSGESAKPANGDNIEENTENTGAEAPAGEEAADFENQTSDDTLVVGVEEINGDFVGGWTNNKTDVKARRYMGIEGSNGYSTVVQDEGGQWVENMTVLKESPETVENEDGSQTTTYKIKEDLKFSDGEPIKAHHYIFGSLLESHPEYQVVTGSTSIGSDAVAGYKEYFAGDKDTFDGFELVDDYTFKVTIGADYLPYFEEASLRGFGPMPAHAITDNLEVAPDGKKLVATEGYEVTEEDKIGRASCRERV